MCSSCPSSLQGPLRPSNLTFAGKTPTARWNLNLNKNLNREPWSATSDILNSVEAYVNPVFNASKVRLCIPVPCPKVQGQRRGGSQTGRLWPICYKLPG